MPALWRLRGLLGFALIDVRRQCDIGSHLAIKACLKSEPNERDLRSEADPQEHLRRHNVGVLGRDRILQIGRPDEQQEKGGGDSRPSVTPPQSNGANEFSHPADINKPGAEREEMGHDRREGGRVSEMDRPAHRERSGNQPRKKRAITGDAAPVAGGASQAGSIP